VCHASLTVAVNFTQIMKVDGFNKMLDWMGKPHCRFSEVLHSNWHHGMHQDLRSVISCDDR
jgi:hypothetical protein